MITSSHNSRIQQVRALLGRRSERKQQNAFVVEGVRLAEEAALSGAPAQLVLYSASLSPRGRALLSRFETSGCPVEEVEESLLRSLSDTETPQGILVVLPLPALALPTDWDFLIIADQIRDPGNLGTLLRTAAASGADGLILTPGTTDAFAPKVVRAAMGANFRLPIQVWDWPQIHQACQTNPIGAAQLLIADSAGGTSCWEANLKRPTALVIGGEAEGAQPAAFQGQAARVHIPMPGQSESLNAAIAAGILIFEVVRQRKA